MPASIQDAHTKCWAREQTEVYPFRLCFQPSCTANRTAEHYKEVTWYQETFLTFADGQIRDKILPVIDSRTQVQDGLGRSLFVRHSQQVHGQ
jgi:hypothetical protein